MKKFLFSALALAGFAACSTDSELNETIAPEQKETFTLSASIVTPDESRVSIGGEFYTEVSWDALDFISIRSKAGLGSAGNTELRTEEGGRTNVKFTGDLAYKADCDTYYAVYPSRSFTSTTVSENYSTQDGTAKEAALLVGKAENAYKYNIDMTFKPVNSLIHVSLTDAPEALSKVVLQQKGVTKGFMTEFSYDIAKDTPSFSGDSVITINNPAADFFIALPGGLALDNGFELVFTTTSGKVFARSYKAMDFPMGSTTTINVKWEEPSVTLGAKTSYSYYANGNATMANQCDNSTIYFNLGPDNADNCRSSYEDIQDSMIKDCGFIVGDTTYDTSNGVTWDKENNQFYMNNMGSQAWQAHTVQAFIETKHNGTITSSDDLHVTGLPYDVSFNTSSAPAGWSKSSNATWGKDSGVQLGSGTGAANISYDSLYLPGDVNTSVSCDFATKGGKTGSWIFTVWYDTNFTLSIGGEDLIKENSNAEANGTDVRKISRVESITMNSNKKSIKCSSSYEVALMAYCYVYSISVDYSSL